MKALVQLGYGSVAEVAVRQVPEPALRGGDLLVRVHAVGLNAADRLLLRGEPFAVRALAGGLRRPRSGFVAGRALAGRVVATGDAVRDFAVGDEVLAETSASLSELVRVPARLTAPKPPGLTFAEAAALPLAGTTALQGVRLAGVRQGQRVLVTGASGGVGHFAVQLAAVRGAVVTGVCAGRATAMVRRLGATHVVDYETDDGPGAGFDVILDLAGNYPMAVLLRALAPGGRLVLSVGTGGRWLGPARRIVRGLVTGGHRVRTLPAHPSREDLSELASMAAIGSIRPVIDRGYPFEEAAVAFAHLDRGPVSGKIVVLIAGSS